MRPPTAAAPAVAPVVGLVTEDEALSALESEWDDLLAASPAPSVFLAWSWVTSWRETMGRRDRLLVATARHPGDGRLIGVAPFVITRRRLRGLLPYRALAFIGQGVAAPDHLDLMVHRDHLVGVAPALWERVRRAGGWDTADLNGVRPGSLVADLAAATATTVRAIPCPVLDLPATWEEYESGLGRNLRQNLRRYARKLERDSGLAVGIRAVTAPADTHEAIGTLVDLHQRVRSMRGEDGAFADPAMVRFHRLLAGRLATEDRLRFYQLEVGGKPIAAIYCIRYGDVVSFYQTGYDPAFARYGPGRHVMAGAIRASIEEGARTFDFLRGDEPYKAAWGAVAVHDLKIRMPRTAWGRVVVGLRRLVRWRRGASGRAGRI